MKKIIQSLLLLLISFSVKGQGDHTVNPSLLKNYWSASWISCPNVPQKDYGVYHFRKTFELSAKPAAFVVNISADNRYRLFVNGKAVCSGPARGDLYNWYFETVDIAPYLNKGSNVVAALVWNMGIYAPVAQISNQTAFVLQGNSEIEQVINTNESWKVFADKAYTPCSTDNGSRLHTYMVVGPGDEVKAALYPWGWEEAKFIDKNWSSAIKIASPIPVGYGTDNMWNLVPRNIPLMEEQLQRIPKIRRSSGVTISNDFLNGKAALLIPANTTVSILLDQTYNTVAYPELITSRGKESTIKLTYSEALFKGEEKGNRNEIEGKAIRGNYDIFEPDGGSRRLFRPLWLRTYRYVQLDIVTKNDPLEINDFYGMYTGYPFEMNAKFTSDDKSLKDIWNVGWRTARLCAGETYYDCPYYEQLQYEGDTRIQALISLYVSGDDRLMRKAILDFHNSRVPEGLTQGRYPSNRIQVIPPFSLYWVSMVHDYWMHRKDDAFTASFLTGIRGVLDWYENHLDKKKNMLGPMKWWNFVDWNTAFPMGTPDGAENGNSSIISLQYVYTLQQAALMFEYYGKKQEADHYRNIASQINLAVYQQCFDGAKGVMANTPAKNSFSQHASIMAVITGCIPEGERKMVMKNVLQDSTLSQATFYYRFYLTRALKNAGMANLYYSQLKPWRDMLKIGLTTFAENPDPSRSDCHAWSASPNYDFLATICGINPDKPGFSSVKIEPALGELKEVKASMPHPKGIISLDLKRRGAAGIKGEINLPPGLTGKFVWAGKEVFLNQGFQKIEL
jgi:hypothetical protein